MIDQLQPAEGRSGLERWTHDRERTWRSGTMGAENGVFTSLAAQKTPRSLTPPRNAPSCTVLLGPGPLSAAPGRDSLRVALRSPHPRGIVPGGGSAAARGSPRGARRGALASSWRGESLRCGPLLAHGESGTERSAIVDYEGWESKYGGRSGKKASLVGQTDRHARVVEARGLGEKLEPGHGRNE